MGSKATITNFKFWPSFKFYFCLPHTQYAAKNQKPLKSGVKWKKMFFFISPQVAFPDGFTKCEKREQKILMLGHL